MMSSSSFEEIVEILSIEKKSNCKKKWNFKYPNIVEAAHYAKAFTLWKASEKYKIPLSSIGRHMSRLFPKK